MKLVDIFGKENVSEDKIDLITYSTDASQLEGKARAVVWPEDAEQIRMLVRYAQRVNLNIVPRAGGTNLSGSTVPDNSIVLDFSRMNKVIEINKKQKYCIVEPGVVLDDLNKALEPDFFFPIIPSSHAICQIGGMIATNSAGNRAVKYGKTKDWILELEVIDGTGKIFTMKENFEDIAGKEGTTGIILKAKLKITGALKDTTSSFYKFNDLFELMEKVNELKKNKSLIALEYFNKPMAKLMDLENKDYLFAEFESDEGETKEKEKIERIWQLRDNCYPVAASKGYIVIEDPEINNDKLYNFLIWLEEKNIPSFGHIGLGIIHPNFKKTDNYLIKEMYSEVKRLNGNITGEHGFGVRKKEFVSDEIKNNLKLLKKKYDPNNILNRGKII